MANLSNLVDFMPVVERGVNVDGEKIYLQFANDVTITTLTMMGMHTQFNDLNKNYKLIQDGFVK